MKKIYRVGVLAILLIVMMGTIACGGNTELNTEETAEITTDFVALTEIKEGRPNIYVIVKSMSSSYWQVVLEGAKQGGIDMECNIYAAGSNLETEWELQEAYMKLAVERNADGIILGPDNSVKLSSAVEMVKAKGIPIVIVDTIVNSPSYDVCYMTDNLLAGENAAKQMIRMFREQGYKDEDVVEVAIELGAINSQTINERLAGFCQYWTKFAPETWVTLDDIKCNDGDEELAKELSKKVFEENPDINGVFGTDNASTMGFASAVLEAENKDVIVVGFDYSPEVAQLIEKGDYNVSVMLQRQYEMGYRGVKTLISMYHGKTVDLKFVDTGVAVLNKDTIDTNEIRGIIEGNNRGK